MTFHELRALMMAAPMPCRTREQIWHHCMAQMQPGDCCLEFGVWYGTSINWMARSRPENTFHGFDSFKGLPEDWIRGHPQGHFVVTDRTRFRWAPNIKIHEGLFADTLKGFDANSIRLVHIDCDLGSSTDAVLAGLETQILAQKPLLLFDEFYNYLGYEDHEFRAFLDFINRTGAALQMVARNVLHQQVLIQML